MPLLVCENIPIKMFYTIQYVYFCYGQNDIHSFSTFVNVNMSIFSPNSTLIVLYVIKLEVLSKYLNKSHRSWLTEKEKKCL